MMHFTEMCYDIPGIKKIINSKTESTKKKGIYRDIQKDKEK